MAMIVSGHHCHAGLELLRRGLNNIISYSIVIILSYYHIISHCHSPHIRPDSIWKLSHRNTYVHQISSDSVQSVYYYVDVREGKLRACTHGFTVAPHSPISQGARWSERASKPRRQVPGAMSQCPLRPTREYTRRPSRPSYRTSRAVRPVCDRGGHRPSSFMSTAYHLPRGSLLAALLGAVPRVHPE